MADRKFQTTSALGKTISGIGWIVVVVSAIVMLASFGMAEKAGAWLGIVGGMVLVVGGGLGILVVALGQLLQIMVEIEYNTRYSKVSASDSTNQDQEIEQVKCSGCGAVWDKRQVGKFCEGCGAPLS